MNSPRDGWPAFPVAEYDHQTFSPETVGDHRRLLSGMSLLEYYAGEAMQIVMAETQETVPATFWDWIKQQAIQFGATFLHVEYRVVNGVYAKAAARAFAYGQAMVAERERLLAAQLEGRCQ